MFKLNFTGTASSHKSAGFFYAFEMRAVGCIRKSLFQLLVAAVHDRFVVRMGENIEFIVFYRLHKPPAGDMRINAVDHIVLLAGKMGFLFELLFEINRSAVSLLAIARTVIDP